MFKAQGRHESVHVLGMLASKTMQISILNQLRQDVVRRFWSSTIINEAVKERIPTSELHSISFVVHASNHSSGNNGKVEENTQHSFATAAQSSHSHSFMRRTGPLTERSICSDWTSKAWHWGSKWIAFFHASPPWDERVQCYHAIFALAPWCVAI